MQDRRRRIGIDRLAGPRISLTAEWIEGAGPATLIGIHHKGVGIRRQRQNLPGNQGLPVHDADEVGSRQVLADVLCNSSVAHQSRRKKHRHHRSGCQAPEIFRVRCGHIFHHQSEILRRRAERCQATAPSSLNFRSNWRSWINQPQSRRQRRRLTAYRGFGQPSVSAPSWCNVSAKRRICTGVNETNEKCQFIHQLVAKILGGVRKFCWWTVR